MDLQDRIESRRMRAFVNGNILSLVAIWLATAILAAGCSSLERWQPLIDRHTGVATSVVIVAVVLFVTFGIRDPIKRGTYLGIVFGGLAEIFIARRVPPNLWNWFLIGGLGAIAILVAGGLVMRLRGSEASVQVPNSGLLAYFVAASLLLAIDIYIGV
ncbi:hypothetical protein GOC18_31520 [Sinorhizobium meliloti]|nr:hypothetical protein [Sinorhizobium meliloti]